MVGVLLGDALGAGFEGHPGPVPVAHVRRHLDASSPVDHTDDTEMTVAVVESLLRCDGLDHDDLSSAFVAHYQREPGRGYGAGTAALLTRLAAGADWRSESAAQFGGRGSWGNGAAMRSAPFGLWATEPEEAAELAASAAQVTHRHRHGVDAAGVQAAAVALALGRTTPRAAFVERLRTVCTNPELGERLDAALSLATQSCDPAQVADRLGASVAALHAVPAAICAFLRHPTSFTDTMIFAIGLGGDTDTIASMAAAISGAALGDHAIPTRWTDRSAMTAAMTRLADAMLERRRGD